MKFWQILQFTPPERLLPLVQAIEKDTLFYGVNLGDHSLFYEKVEGEAAFVTDGKMPWPASTPWPDLGTAFGAMAAVTTRLHFVSSICIVPHHHPFDIARMMSTVSVMSGNRGALGTGVGWLEIEYKALGLDFRARGKRYDEALDVIRLLWSGGMVEYHGDHFDFPRGRLTVKPAGHIPLYAGGDSPAAVRRAALKADGWISNGADPEVAFKVIATLRRHLKDAGRENQPFEIIANVQPDLDRIKRLRDIGVTGIFNLASMDQLMGRQTLQQQIDQSRRYSDDIIAKL
jgi:probable F420-dependent oxidoreductase